MKFVVTQNKDAAINAKIIDKLFIQPEYFYGSQDNNNHHYFLKAAKQDGDTSLLGIYNSKEEAQKILMQAVVFLSRNEKTMPSNNVHDSMYFVCNLEETI